MTKSRTTLIAAIELLGALVLGGCRASQPDPTPRTADVRLTAAQATAPQQQERGSFSVSYEVSRAPTTVLAPSCDSAGQCAFPYANVTSTFTGDIVGTAVGTGSAVIGTDFASSVANTIVTATIGPCGSGTYVIRYFIVYDVHDLSAGEPGTWQVVPGLGSGDLASLTGNGTFTVTQSNPDLSNVSVWNGRVRCGMNNQDEARCRTPRREARTGTSWWPPGRSRQDHGAVLPGRGEDRGARSLHRIRRQSTGDVLGVEPMVADHLPFGVGRDRPAEQLVVARRPRTRPPPACRSPSSGGRCRVRASGR